jgi:hypothetical protein
MLLSSPSRWLVVEDGVDKEETSDDDDDVDDGLYGMLSGSLLLIPGAKY